MRPLLLASLAGALLAAPSAAQLGFMPPRDVPLGGGENLIFDAHTGDVDGDGLVDILLSDFVSGTEVVRNLGDGAFAPVAQDGGTPGLAPTGRPRLADVDGDGHLDIFVKLHGHAIAVAFGRGDGSFEPPVTSNPNPPLGNGSGGLAVGGVFGLVLADLTQDGVLDVATLMSPSIFGGTLDVWFYVGLGDGTFAPGQIIGATESSIHGGVIVGGAFSSRDVDGDGDLDLAFLDRRLGPFPDVPVPTAVVLRNQGVGAFQEVATTLQILADGGTFLDADGDGITDVLVELSGVGQLSRGQGDGRFGYGLPTYAVAPAQPKHPGGPGFRLDLSAHDLDGDGRDDVIRTSGVDVTLLRAFGSGWLVPQLDLPGLGEHMAPRVAEFDGDGRPDLIGGFQWPDGTWGLRVATNLTYPASSPFEDQGGLLPTPQHLMLQIAAGTLAPASPVTLKASGVPSGAFVWLVVGLDQVGLPFQGGTIGPRLDLVHGPLPTGGHTASWWSGAWPDDVPSGTRAYSQVWSFEPPATWSSTSTVQLTAP